MAPKTHPRRYHDWSEVPRDLRSAAQLTARGFRDLGPVAAEVRTDEGAVALHSTSEARRRRDGMWHGGTQATPPAGVPTPAGQARESRDLVRNLARGSTPRPGEARRGRCTRCGRDAVGLIEDVCRACRRAERETALRSAAFGWLGQLLEGDFVVLDTETTGLGRRDEVIEIGVVDADGRTLLESMVWPRAERVPAASTRVHGLRLDDLRGAPTWPRVLERLQEVTRGRRILAWNAPFDERIALQSSRLWHVPHGLPAFECAMRAYALARGVPAGRMKLEAAAREQAVLDREQTHRSAEDARLTLEVLLRLAEHAG
jgi:DNA polymerase-3 subunit epsilon